MLLIDATVLCAAALLSYGALGGPGPVILSLGDLALILPLPIVLALFLSVRLGLAKTKLNTFGAHAIGLTFMMASAVAALVALITLLRGPEVTLAAHAAFGMVFFAFSCLSRSLLLSLVLDIYRRGGGRRRVVIYGAGSTGIQLANAFKTDAEIEPVAFFDDNPALHGVVVAGLPVLAPRQIEAVFEDRNIDRVLLAMPSQSHPKQAQIARRLQSFGVEVLAVPSFAQLARPEDMISQLSAVPAQAFLGREARNMSLGALSKKFEGRSILVSGAGGSIGSEICRQVLACRPAKLILFELSELALYNIHMELCQATEGTEIEVIPVLGSVTDARHVRKVLTENGVEVILHAAAYKHVPLVELNPLSGLANNVFGTQTLAKEAASFGVERFILISSDKAVRPTNVMGASKRLAELIIQDLATRNPETIFTMVRFGNVLGSSGSVVPLFQEQVRRGGPVTVTDPRVVRYFMTLHEAVQLVLTAGADARGGEVFVLDMGKPVPILQLARQVIESAGYSVKDDMDPDGDIEIQVIGLRQGEKLAEELSLSGDLLATSHQKIFFVQESRLSEIEVASVLRALKHALANNDEPAALAELERWVEDFTQDARGAKMS